MTLVVVGCDDFEVEDADDALTGRGAANSDE
jgi:hypothetical protein